MSDPISPLVEADWIAEHLDDPTLRLVEVDVSPVAYEKGHIPGAVLWNAYTDLRHPDYSPVSTVEFEQLLSRSGLTPEMSVVFYGYGSHLGFWLMKAYGHDRVRLMDGTRDRWQTAGHRWSVEVPVPTPSSYTLPSGESDLRSSRVAVEGMLGKPDQVILDVRSKAEYEGDYFWPSGATEGAGRAGHIPRSVHLPIELLRNDDGLFRSSDEIRQVMCDHGVVPEHGVVSYCTIGNRASQAWFALTYLLGYPDARVYYGSWAEWGTLSDTPIET